MNYFLTSFDGLRTDYVSNSAGFVKVAEAKKKKVCDFGLNTKRLNLELEPEELVCCNAIEDP